MVGLDEDTKRDLVDAFAEVSGEIRTPRRDYGNTFAILGLVLSLVGMVVGGAMAYGTMGERVDRSVEAVKELDAEKVDKALFAEACRRLDNIERDVKEILREVKR